MKGTSLVAVGRIDASGTNILAASPVAMSLTDSKGAAITGNKLPASISRIQILKNVTSNVLVCVKISAVPAWEKRCGSQSDAFECLFSAGQEVGLQSADANITTGIYTVLFYA